MARIAYISNLSVEVKNKNDDIVQVSSSFLSDEGDIFTLERDVLDPRVIETDQYTRELQPEVSSKYPFKVLTPRLTDSASLIYSPSIETFPTASQNYYTPIIFERYNEAVLRALDKRFIELESRPVDLGDPPGE